VHVLALEEQRPPAGELRQRLLEWGRKVGDGDNLKGLSL
jgi:hypothetical protein